jgi:nucleoside-diphosphate-sugar epimerase
MLVFASSISPYGPSERVKTEASVPVPETPYGHSKLAAEKVHLNWQTSQVGRKLMILRPGVVFGSGEEGNVTRLVRSLVKGYFVYLGNRKTIKAGGYVKELCRVILFGLKAQGEAELPVLLINFTMDPPPTLEQMVNAILKVIGKARKPLSVPLSLALGLSYSLLAVERVLGVKLPINPVRVRKLVRSNNVCAEQLKALGYEYSYTLESAFRDWKQDQPEDFAG